MPKIKTDKIEKATAALEKAVCGRRDAFTRLFKAINEIEGGLKTLGDELTNVDREAK
jgi:hypothetical protein